MNALDQPRTSGNPILWQVKVVFFFVPPSSWCSKPMLQDGGLEPIGVINTYTGPKING